MTSLQSHPCWSDYSLYPFCCQTIDDYCNDNNICTTETCELGTCIYSNNSEPCQDDGNECTIDACYEGICTHDASNCGEVVGDPHFTGLDGSKFDFNGVAGSIYALISGPQFQYNVEFKELETFTYIGTIGARIGNDLLIYTSGDELFYNNESISEEKYWKTITTSWGKIHKVKEHFILEFRDWKIKAGIVSDPRTGFSFINIWSIGFLGLPDSTYHGLIGQTTRPRKTVPDCHLYVENGGCQIEGYSEDYLVRSGIFGTDFTFTRFDRNSTFDPFQRTLLNADDILYGSVVHKGKNFM